MSGPAPKTYGFEAALISLAIAIGIILFLRSSWGGH